VNNCARSARLVILYHSLRSDQVLTLKENSAHGSQSHFAKATRDKSSPCLPLALTRKYNHSSFLAGVFFRNGMKRDEGSGQTFSLRKK
jgi:hypothetical protein